MLSHEKFLFAQSQGSQHVESEGGGRGSERECHNRQPQRQQKLTHNLLLHISPFDIISAYTHFVQIIVGTVQYQTEKRAYTHNYSHSIFNDRI